MTTSWAHLVRGELTTAARANFTGTLLGVMTVLSVLWLLISAGRGFWLGWVPTNAAAAWIGTGVLALMFTEWVLRLWMA